VVIESLYPGAYAAEFGGGFRLLVEEVPSSRSASVGIWVRVGSRDDPGPRPGLAHFLEHLLFKGTSTLDAVEISRAIDGIGGHLDGATTREATVYFAEVPANGLSRALEVLADLVQHPRFAPDALERERGVVLEEIRGHDDDPEQTAYDLFSSGLWREHPLSRPVLGSPDTIRTVSHEEVVAHYRRFYRPDNMILVVSGAVEAQRVADLAASLFELDVPSTDGPTVRTVPHLQGGRWGHHQDSGQMHLFVGLPGTDLGDEDRFALSVVNSALGGGMSARLFHLIREERGLAYAVYSATLHYSDTGAWLIYAGVAPENASQVVALILEQLDRLRREGITDEELQLAKSKLHGNLILNLEANSDRMFRLGGRAVAGQPISAPEELIARLEAVGRPDIERVIARLASGSDPNVTWVGPQASGAVL
jgi:predicted Zn-dependent peptidase